MNDLLKRGLYLEYATLGWNVVGIGIIIFAAIAAHSVALAGFGLDSLIEIGASLVVVWQLKGVGQDREKIALKIIGASFFAHTLGMKRHSFSLDLFHKCRKVRTVVILSAAKNLLRVKIDSSLRSE